MSQPEDSKPRGMGALTVEPGVGWGTNKRWTASDNQDRRNWGLQLDFDPLSQREVSREYIEVRNELLPKESINFE